MALSRYDLTEDIFKTILARNEMEQIHSAWEANPNFQLLFCGVPQLLPNGSVIRPSFHELHDRFMLVLNSKQKAIIDKFLEVNIEISRYVLGDPYYYIDNDGTANRVCADEKTLCQYFMMALEARYLPLLDKLSDKISAWSIIQTLKPGEKVQYFIKICESHVPQPGILPGLNKFILKLIEETYDRVVLKKIHTHLCNELKLVTDVKTNIEKSTATKNQLAKVEERLTFFKMSLVNAPPPEKKRKLETSTNPKSVSLTTSSAELLTPTRDASKDAYSDYSGMTLFNPATEYFYPMDDGRDYAPNAIDSFLT